MTPNQSEWQLIYFLQIENFLLSIHAHLQYLHRIYVYINILLLLLMAVCVVSLSA